MLTINFTTGVFMLTLVDWFLLLELHEILGDILNWK